MGVGILQNLKGFTSKHPPLLVFVICLLLFGLAAMLLAYVVGETELPNPDVKTDWNTFLSNLTKWDICMQPIKSSSLNRHFLHHNTKSGRESVTVPVTISWTSIVPRGSVLFSGTVRSPSREKDLLNVNFRFPDYVERNDTCHDGSCTATVPVCLTFTGSLYLLPKTSRSQQECIRCIGCEFLGLHIPKFLSVPKPQRCWEDAAQNWINITFHEASTSAKHCSKKQLLKATYVPDPDLTVMLTYGERSLVNMHLMHTSYFLLVVALTLLCSILLRGHFRPNARSETKVHLHPETNI